MDVLSEKEKLLLSIPPFFEGIELFHQALFYPTLFKDDHLLITQNNSLPAPLAASQLIEAQGGMKKIEMLGDVYTQDGLEVYFSTLRRGRKA